MNPKCKLLREGDRTEPYKWIKQSEFQKYTRVHILFGNAKWHARTIYSKQSVKRSVLGLNDQTEVG